MRDSKFESPYIFYSNAAVVAHVLAMTPIAIKLMLNAARTAHL
jgi:hypothetical protein